MNRHDQDECKLCQEIRVALRVMGVSAAFWLVALSRYWR